MFFFSLIPVLGFLEIMPVLLLSLGMVGQSLHIPEMREAPINMGSGQPERGRAKFPRSFQGCQNYNNLDFRGVQIIMNSTSGVSQL